MLTKENGFKLPLKWNFPDGGKYAFTFVSLLVILLAVYANSFYGDWHFDDFANIVNNPYIQIKDFSWENIKHCIYGLEQQRPSRPLAYLSFALNYQINGLDVFGYHLVNFIIHYFAAVFLFLFIYNTLKLPLLKERYENIAYPVALLAVFFWAINPVFVTTISYIVQRMALMAGMFYIMSMYFYLKARTTDKRGRAVCFFIISVLAGLASILSKENAALLPVSVLLFDLFLIQGISKENVNNVFKIVILPLIIIIFFALIYTGGLSNAVGGYDLRDFTMGERLLTEPRVIIFYLSLLFYPVNSRLTLLYDADISRSLFQPWTTLPAILLILTALALALYLVKKRPLLSYCIFFYFLNHLIEGSFFSLELIYEHRNYLPSMLLFIPLAELIIFAIDYFSHNKIIQIIFASVIVIILTAWGDSTFRRNGIFSSDYLLWQDNILKSPRLSRPHSNIGRIYYNYNDQVKAQLEYDKALHLNNFGSKQALAIQQFNSGLLYFMQRKDDAALDCFENSSKYLPEYLLNDILAAKIKIRQNKLREAKKIIEDKLKKYPRSLELMELYSFILWKDGKFRRSEALAREHIYRKGNSTLTLMILAESCRQKNNLRGAIFYWQSIRNTAPQNPWANLALIELYAKINSSHNLLLEIKQLINWKGSLNLSEYVNEQIKNNFLLPYNPDLENIRFILKKHGQIFL
ncbi:MAG: hypothetical protein ABFD75_06935 [Smithella sp.]